MSLQRTIEWFDEAIPITKTTKLAQAKQLGVHVEEFVEMLETIQVSGTDWLTKTCIDNLTLLANKLKQDQEVILTITDRKEFLDAMTDQLVTASGTARLLGMDILGALGNVNDSNFSKFVDGKAIFTEHGKIAKGPNYVKPDLTPFVGIDVTELAHPPL